VQRIHRIFLAVVASLAVVLSTGATGNAAETESPRTAPAAASATASAAAGAHTVTFVNRSGKKLWIGSIANKGEPDGNSKNLKSLPALQPGQSATVTIPENEAPSHWRGKFFARQGCTGTPGSTFHCAIGDCGEFAQHCQHGEQPISLAEFNFDKRDADAPWYQISYVNALSLPITITPKGAPNVTPNGSCSQHGCKKNLLPNCPTANRVHNTSGATVLCVNPNRDAPTACSRAVTKGCPKAYSWSKQDQQSGNNPMRQCSDCQGFVVTFW
jgi:hypothetical protein